VSKWLGVSHRPCHFPDANPVVEDGEPVTGQRPSPRFNHSSRRITLLSPARRAGGSGVLDVAIQFFGCNYPSVKVIQEPIGVAKFIKYPANGGVQSVRAALLALPTSVVSFRPGAAHAASSARFRPSRKWVAKFREYCTVPHSFQQHYFPRECGPIGIASYHAGGIRCRGHGTESVRDLVQCQARLGRATGAGSKMSATLMTFPTASPCRA
jgi:hypothetical protein